MDSLATCNSTYPPSVNAPPHAGWCSPASHDVGALRPRFFVLSVITACVALVGCAGVHLHDDQAAKVAGQARTAFKDSGVDQPFTSERDLIADQNRRQLAAARQFTTAYRDAALMKIVGSGSAWHENLTEAVSTRMKDLISDPQSSPDRDAHRYEWTTFVSGVVAAREEVGSATRDLSMEMNSYSQIRETADPPSRCPTDSAPGGVGAPRLPRAQVSFNLLRTACKALGTKQDKVVASFDATKSGSALAVANKRLDDLEEERHAAQNAVGVAQNAFDAAVTAYKQAAKRPDDQAALNASIATLQSTFNALATSSAHVTGLLPNQWLRGETASLQEQIASIDAVLGALRGEAGTGASNAGGAGAPPAAFLQVVALIPKLATTINDAHAPRTSALLIESERLRFQLARAKLHLAADDDRIAAARSLRDAIVDEVDMLNRVFLTLDAYAANQNCFKRQKGQRLDAIYQSAPPCGELVDTALLQYADSWNYGRLPEREAMLADIFIQHRTALDLSESAFGEWAAVIDIPLAQVVAYHESGLRPEDWANLIQALGLGSIAVRVK